MPFQLTQRADFFEEEVGLETTLKRPIVNTRDEPHCDSQKYRRLHVIVGDANLAEVATFLKVGTTAIVLSMIEDDAVPTDLALANPVGAIRQVSQDPHACSRTDPPARTAGALTALELQWQLLEQARKYERERGLETVGEEVGAEVLRRWEEVLTGLERDRSSWPTQVDWVAKERLLDGYRSATTSTGAMPGCGRSTCSTTTCAPSGRCSPGSGWSALVAATPRSSGP